MSTAGGFSELGVTFLVSFKPYYNISCCLLEGNLTVMCVVVGRESGVNGWGAQYVV